MSKRTKDLNQYYGKYFENAVCSSINGTEIKNLTGYNNFSEEDIKEMNKHAINCASIINGKNAKWVGNKTSSEDCDIIIDNKHYEIKYVSGGKGTYLNTSLEYLPRILGFPSYLTYMKDEIYPILEKFFGKKVYENISPVSIEEAKYFMKNNSIEYKELSKLDKKVRKRYVEDLYIFLSSNPNKLNRLISDCLSKNESGKNPSDELVIYNYKKNITTIISKDTIEKLKESKTFKNTGLGLAFDNIRIAIGWQNGTALCNPTIRVFIK